MWKAAVQPKHGVLYRFFLSVSVTLFLLIVVLRMVLLRSFYIPYQLYATWFWCWIGRIWKRWADFRGLLNKDGKRTCSVCFLFLFIQNWINWIEQDLRNFTFTRLVSSTSFWWRLFGPSLIEFKWLSDSLLLHVSFGVGASESDLTGAKLLSSSFRFLKRQHKTMITVNNINFFFKLW